MYWIFDHLSEFHTETVIINCILNTVHYTEYWVIIHYNSLSHYHSHYTLYTKYSLLSHYHTIIIHCIQIVIKMHILKMIPRFQYKKHAAGLIVSWISCSIFLFMFLKGLKIQTSTRAVSTSTVHCRLQCFVFFLK